MADPTIVPTVADAVTAAQAMLRLTTVQAANAEAAAVDASDAATSAVAETFYGLYALDPTSKPSGLPSQDGDMYYNTTNKQLRMFVSGRWEIVATTTAGGTLVANNNLSDLTSIPQARNNFGLGTSATLPVGVPFGVASLGVDGRVPSAQLPGGTAALQPSNNLSDVSSVATSRTNLGLGTAATLNVGAASGVAGLDTGSKVPLAQLPAGAASGLATLDVAGHVPLTQLNAGQPSGIATLTAGGLITPSQLPGGVSPTSIAKSADYTTVTGDAGKVIVVTTGSSADVTITLVSAATAGDGTIMAVQKVDTGNKKCIVSDGAARAWLSNQNDIAVFRSNGSAWLVYWTEITPRVETFTADGAWTKPPLARLVRAEVWGPGGGGGSGSRAGSTYGGTGGGGGAYVNAYYYAGDLAATETMAVPAGGNGGAGSTTTGNVGSAGGTTTFGAILKLQANGGAGGNGGGTVGGVAGGSIWGIPAAAAGAIGFEGAGGSATGNGSSAIFGGGGSGTQQVGTGIGGSSAFGSGAGGRGGANDGSMAPGAGGSTRTVTPGGGGAAGANGSAGTAGTAGNARGLGGGGGGGSSTGSVGGVGGAGGVGAGGGGGGGSSTGTSGAGGVGGRGEAVITTYF